MYFHVVVVQRRQRNVQKSVTHQQSYCFANINLLLFCRRRCLRSLFCQSLIGCSRPVDRRRDTLESSQNMLPHKIAAVSSTESYHPQSSILYYTILYSFFLGKSVQAGKGAMRLTLCEAPTRETRPDHYTGNSVPYSLRQVSGFFNVPC